MNFTKFILKINLNFSSYSYKKNERIIAYFGNFEDYLDEDAMWQISETIKPRGGKKSSTVTTNGGGTGN